MFRLEKPDELKQVDDLDLVRMTRYEVLDRYGVLPMHYRAQVIREQVLTPEVLKDMIAKVLAMPEGVKKGRLVWEALLPLVPLQPHGLDRFDVQNAAMETLRREEQRFEFESSAWWWRLRCGARDRRPDGVGRGAEGQTRRKGLGAGGCWQWRLAMRACR